MYMEFGNTPFETVLIWIVLLSVGSAIFWGIIETERTIRKLITPGKVYKNTSLRLAIIAMIVVSIVSIIILAVVY